MVETDEAIVYDAKSNKWMDKWEFKRECDTEPEQGESEIVREGESIV